VTKPANVSEMAGLGTICDDHDECISGYQGDRDRLRDMLDRQEQERHQRGQVEDAEIDLPEVDTTADHEENAIRMKDQNEAMANDSDSENEIKYGQHRSAANSFSNIDEDNDGESEQREEEEEEEKTEDEVDTSLQEENVIRIKDNNEATGNDSESENEIKYGQQRLAANSFSNIGEDNEDDSEQRQSEQRHDEEEEEEQQQKQEEQEEIKEDEHVVVAEENGEKERAQEAEEMFEDEDDDASERNSFHLRTVNMTAAESEKTSTTMTTSSIETGEQADVVEKYDFDTNNFVVESPSYTDNASRSSVKTDVVEVDLLSESEDTEMAKSSPTPLDSNEAINLIRQHTTENAGK